MSETTITICACCGQEMHGTDLLESLRAQVAELTQELALEKESGDHWCKAYSKWVQSDATAIALIKMQDDLAAMTQERDWLDHKSKCLEMERRSQEKYLAEGQAREQQLRDELGNIWKAYTVYVSNGGGSWRRHVEDAICEAKKTVSALPSDDTCLKQWGAKLLRGVADEMPVVGAHTFIRRKATKLDPAA